MVKLTGAVAAGTALAGCSGGEDTEAPAEDDDEPTDGGGSTESFDGWFDGVDNYDGVVDETGADSVTVTVGAGSDGFLFDPAAIRVSSGTTVTWEWTNKGGSHNVVADDGSFESELVGEEGHTFEQTFDATGEFKYFCRPHKTMGMKGVVIVE
jgi:halocyanin-like protein